ncbi:probable RNA helicase SDE3 [Momordica charantia]|uniref:Probable RNA helicase SDE3 n=1 Tax=Momordica charantia TaxID=3673 RepID=A0A6J1CIT5_MOMCH|nr:probable RNA helicase SDE3 [Momordica charantia]
MSLLLDILRCFCCCFDDSHFDNNYNDISTANSYSRTCVLGSSYKITQSDTSTATPLLSDYYPNRYKAKESDRFLRPPSPKILEKSTQASHNANASRPHFSSSVFPKPSSQPVAPLSGKSTLSSHLTPSSSINATPKGVPSPSKLPASSPKPPPTSNPTLHPGPGPGPHPSNKTYAQEYVLDGSGFLPSSKPAVTVLGRITLPKHLSPSNSINAPSLSSSSSCGSNSPPSTPPRLQTASKQPSPSPLFSGLTQNLANQLVSSPKLRTATSEPSKTSLPSPSTCCHEPPQTSNPTLRPASSSKTNPHEYVLDANSSLPLYLIPRDVEDLIKNDIVPQVLRKPLSPLTYKSGFAALLHAEDFYYKKWSNYKLENVSLELQQITIHKRTNKKTKFNGHEKVNKTFVAIEIDSVPERRPFLLSRDLVHARLCGRNLEPFQGFVYRIAKSNTALGRKSFLLVDFGDDFHSRHHETNKYDISFTFNRVCLKRAHQAVEVVSDSLFQNFLFPGSRSTDGHACIQVTHYSHQQLDPDQKNAVRQISLLRGSPPYLIRGPPSVLVYGWGENRSFGISRTGAVVKGAAFQIYSTSPNSRILICAPTNTTCDHLMISLKKVIPESKMFRATAAFRELKDVPYDILSLCDYDEINECFTCPSLDELHEYKIIFSTFMSSFRLHAKGLAAGHFSHIFLLDASAAIEPETLVPLTKFATDATAVVVTGEAGKQPNWVRSSIARRHGLKVSYFERLEEKFSYRNLDPLFISEVYEEDPESRNSFVL